MDEKNHDHVVEEPQFEGEEMKMPENTDAPPVENAPSGHNSGPILLILLVALLLILGGLYFWFASLQTTPVTTVTPLPVTTERPTPEENNEPESTTAESEVEALNTVSTSDELGAIESDIEATDLDSLDAELEAIDAELEAALNEM